LGFPVLNVRANGLKSLLIQFQPDAGATARTGAAAKVHQQSLLHEFRNDAGD
jgi:hypothetical protein